VVLLAKFIKRLKGHNDDLKKYNNNQKADAFMPYIALFDPKKRDI